MKGRERKGRRERRTCNIVMGAPNIAAEEKMTIESLNGPQTLMTNPEVQLMAKTVEN